MENEREVLVEVNHLNVTYGSGKKAYEAVQDANFKIYKGETFGLVGESGSGKTTIGRADTDKADPRLIKFRHDICRFYRLYFRRGIPPDDGERLMIG